MNTAITVEHVAALIGFLTFLGIVVGWVLRALAKRDAEITANARAIADLKLHIAEHYATKAGLNESLNLVHDALDRLTNRIDTMLDAQSKPVPSRGRRTTSGSD